MPSTISMRATASAWPSNEPYQDHARGTLKSGKEAEIFLVERRFTSGSRLITNSDAYDLLHRDLSNVGDFFARHGLAINVEATYAELIALAW